MKIPITAALTHLKKIDPIMGKLIERVGPCTLKSLSKRSIFETLLSSIANQQLNGRAAATILKRFYALLEDGKATPEAVLKLSVSEMRASGFSGSKIQALQDLASKTIEGVVPTSRQASRMSDAEIIKRLIAVRGVGQWTAEMLLMFKLNRPDILPVGDFGVRKGFGIVYRNGVMPSPKEVAEYGARWAPHRSTASWYLWRACDLQKGNLSSTPQI